MKGYATTRSSSQHLPLYVDETGGLSISQLTARARRLKRQKGLDMIVVDYIQLLQGSGKRGNDNRVQEVTEITTSLKALAKELNIPVIALSQLSRRSKTATTSILNWLICVNPVRSSRTPTSCCSCTAKNIISQNKEPQARYTRAREVETRHGARFTARPRSSLPSSATDQRVRSHCNSKGNSRGLVISSKGMVYPLTVCP